jgi:hypothetical protein
VRGGAAKEEGAVGELEGLLHPAVALPTVLAGGGGERQQGEEDRAPHRALVARAATEGGRRGGKGPPWKEGEGEFGAHGGELGSARHGDDFGRVRERAAARCSARVNERGGWAAGDF